MGSGLTTGDGTPTLLRMLGWPELLERAFRDLDAFLKGSDWWGRENEVVNLFVHRFLPAQISAMGPFRSLRQVGIEVAVELVAGTKRWVRKDLVIWPDNDMTAWTPDAVPAAIVEWKRNDPAACDADAAWLKVFCTRYPRTVGYTACALLRVPRGCRFTRITV